MTDNAEKLMHNSKSRKARSWVSKDIQQEQDSQAPENSALIKMKRKFSSYIMEFKTEPLQSHV
jgi:hypothetical protein